jgi:hypothetical protein
VDQADQVEPEATSRAEEVVGQRALLKGFELRAKTKLTLAIHGFTSRLGLDNLDGQVVVDTIRDDLQGFLVQAETVAGQHDVAARGFPGYVKRSDAFGAYDGPEVWEMTATRQQVAQRGTGFRASLS